MLNKVLECPHCRKATFVGWLTHNNNDSQDTHTYLELICNVCSRPALNFVVDLAAEFDHAQEVTNAD